MGCAVLGAAINKVQQRVQKLGAPWCTVVIRGHCTVPFSIFVELVAPQPQRAIWACFETSPEERAESGMFRRDELRRAVHVGWTAGFGHKVYHAWRVGREGGGLLDGKDGSMKIQQEGQRVKLCLWLAPGHSEFPSYIQLSTPRGQRKQLSMRAGTRYSKEGGRAGLGCPAVRLQHPLTCSPPIRLPRASQISPAVSPLCGGET
jgi:hypothetical protein